MVLLSVHWVSHPRKSREWAMLLGVVRGRGRQRRRAGEHCQSLALERGVTQQ